MAHTSNRLTAVTVRNAGPGRHADGAGLFLWVKDSGAKYWVLRAMANGKRHDIGLGRASGVDPVSLANARLLASEARAKLTAGIDPVKERAARKAQAQTEASKAITFRTVAEAYLDRHEGGWRNAKHREQWRATLSSYVYPHFGDVPVASVETAHVLIALEAIWTIKPETASRVRGRIETILDNAKVRGLRAGENPARWRGHLQHALPARKRLSRGHHAAMPYGEVPAFLEALRCKKSASALALEFAILTAARTGEVIGARWEEMDLERRVWTVPASRMKAGKEHRVALSARAVAILEEMALMGCQWCFSADRVKPLSSMAMLMTMRRMHPELTVHGFRSSFRDWASETTAFSGDTVEMALAHVIANKVEAAYRRGDLFEKRVRLMAAWEAFCAAPGATAGDNVTPLRGAAVF
jgi:integrase